MAKEIENKPKTKGNPSWKKGGSSPNPGGRPNNAISLTAIAKRFLAMTPTSIADEIGQQAAKLKALKSQSTMAEIVMASFLYALAVDPQPGNMRELWRRIDGEVVAPSIDVDLTKLSTEQLERLANGEDVLAVLATPGAGATGTTEAPETDR